MSLVRLPDTAASSAELQRHVRAFQSTDGAFEHAWRKFNAASETSLDGVSRAMARRYPFAPRKAVEFAAPLSRLESWGLHAVDLHEIRALVVNAIEPAGERCASPAAQLELHFFLADTQSCLHCMKPVHPPMGSGLLLSDLSARLVQSEKPWTECREAVASIADMLLRDILGEPKSAKGEEALWCHASLRAKTRGRPRS